MYQPETIRFGFKTPPVANANGRGPPIQQKREFFFLPHLPLSVIILYSLNGQATFCDTLKG
jgi:hypothetical protein